jgi:1A family penicillin-binding protein
MATTSTPPRRPAAPQQPTTPNGKRPAPKRKGSGFWRGVKAFFQVVTFFTLLALVTLIAWVFLRLYGTPSTIDINGTPLGITYVYSSDGTPLAEFFTERRRVVPVEDIPKNLMDATVAFEDKRFYSHSGVDFKGIARALYSNIRHSDLKGEGGSTITQQLARNLGVEGLDRRKSAGRKFNELIVAHQIESSYTKQDILTMYLNQVNYGSGAYGVEAAAEVYFNRHVKQLDLAQCALLAGLPNRPNDYNPYKDMKASRGQQRRVLEQMLGQGMITMPQFQHAVKEPIKLAGAKAPSQGSQIFHAPFFVNYVVDQLRRKYGADRIYQGNLKVYTTLNWAMQQIAEREVKEGIARAGGRGPTQGCLVALDPKTGEIKAMVGGTDYKKSQFNIATQARRQPGSSFKAVVYSAAINDGSVKESTRVLDARVVFPAGGKPYVPKDDNGYSDGYVDLRTAMAYSINVPAVKVLHLIGPQTAVRYARMMGIHSPLDPVLSLALGSSGVTPLEMASVYSTFPAGGNHPEPAAWTRLADMQDNVIEDVPPVIETHVLQKETVTQLDDMLRAVVTEPRGTGHVVADQVPDARGKTGTTQGHKDVWFVGYTPDLVCAVWAGHPIYRSKNLPPAYGQEMEGNAWGATVCAPIWAKFMSQSLPIFHAARAREAARLKAKQAPVVKPVTKADEAAAVNADGTPTPPDNTDTPPDSPTPRRRPRASRPHDNGDGTVTVNVDDGSGLLAPEGTPGSHPETFTAGSQPTALSPNYSAPPDASGGGGSDNGNSPNDAPAPTAPSDSSDGPRSRRHRRHHSTDDTVTMDINPEDGLRATKWDPQTVTRTFPRGQEPHSYSRMYSPPPGEQ